MSRLSITGGSRLKIMSKIDNMGYIRETINRFVETEKKADMMIDSMEQHWEWNEERKEIMRNEKYLLDSSRKADASDYEEWLYGFTLNGGKPTHWYDYGFDRNSGFIVMRDNIKIPKLYGALAMQIIVPEHIECDCTDIGHNDIYFMEGFKIIGNFIPIYDDIRF